MLPCPQRHWYQRVLVAVAAAVPWMGAPKLGQGWGEPDKYGCFWHGSEAHAPEPAPSGCLVPAPVGWCWGGERLMWG